MSYQIINSLKIETQKLESFLIPDRLELEKLSSKFLEIVSTLGLKIITCIIVYYVGRFIISWLEKILKRILERKNIDHSAKTFLNSLVDIALKVMLFFPIIGILGIETTSFAALIASAGLAVGMAMKDNLGNFAGGVMILFNKPIKIGDYIFAQGQEGRVTAIGILYTLMTTLDNKTIFIPNGPLSTGNIVNFSTQGTRRVDITVGVAYGTSSSRVKEILNEIIKADPKILQDPEPLVALTKLNDNSVDFIIRTWAKSEDYWTVYFGLNEKIYETFNEKNVDIPFPQITVHMSKE
ncbi:MAG: mechanosensitive ion channel [Flavobacteriaceae bacterium]|jgi:small conductance mechanosensitive channel|nr:mechanosensitive ion channel [Flavobacteriaceae bacterium]